VSAETLGDFVRRVRKEKRLTLADVSRRSARVGKRISRSYINRIENDPKRKITADRLNAFAHGLGIPVGELVSRVMGKIPDHDPDALRLLHQFRELSPERRADVLKIIELWL
jgi:transcriptional regulator with XRE-family HTH domain